MALVRHPKTECTETPSETPNLVPENLRIMLEGSQAQRINILSLVILYLLTGLLAGSMAGLIGIGGGLVVVPILDFIFVHYNIGPSIHMHMAAACSLPPAPQPPALNSGRATLPRTAP